VEAEKQPSVMVADIRASMGFLWRACDAFFMGSKGNQKAQTIQLWVGWAGTITFVSIKKRGRCYFSNSSNRAFRCSYNQKYHFILGKFA